MEAAPFRSDLVEGPDDAVAVWAITEDEVQIRVVLWKVRNSLGTILIFPGRTEYGEKYARVARDLTASGYSVATVDWRGQGLSDRLVDDRLLGHVMSFTDYQRDVAAFLSVIDDAELPGSRFLVAHSMGGCIGLRALIEGLPVRRAVFSAPMWGIEISATKRPLAMILPGLARLVNQHLRYTPGSRPVDFVMESGFAVNPLTSDRDHFAMMARQLTEAEEFALGGPSLHWLGEALKECRTLRSMPRPEYPALIFVGTEETIVSVESIEQVALDWPGAELRVVEGARHELMMEAPLLRERFMSETLDFFGRDRA